MFGGLAIVAGLAIRSSDHASGRNRSAEIEANREDRALVEEDQAPHVKGLPHATSARIALERDIAADVMGRIRRQDLSGPVQRTRCAASGSRQVARQAFRCSVRTGGVRYPFLGVADMRARSVTWCKRDPPADPALDIPVSRRCRA